MPQSLVDKIERSSKFNQGYATLEYLSAAIVDMDLHTRPEGVDDMAAFEQRGARARSAACRARSPCGIGFRISIICSATTCTPPATTAISGRT